MTNSGGTCWELFSSNGLESAFVEEIGHGSILGNTLLTGRRRLSGRDALVLTRLRRAQAQVFTHDSVTLASHNLNHAGNWPKRRDRLLSSWRGCNPNPMDTRTVPWLHSIRLLPREQPPNRPNGEQSVPSRSLVRYDSLSPLVFGNKSNKPQASTDAGKGFAGHCSPSS